MPGGIHRGVPTAPGSFFQKKKKKYWGLSGAKACKSCRSRQELSNEYFLAKFGFDTAENNLVKFSFFFLLFFSFLFFLFPFFERMSPARWGHPDGCPPAWAARNVISAKKKWTSKWTKSSLPWCKNAVKVLKPHQNSIVEMLQCARIIFESSNLISKKIMNHIDNFHEPRGRLCWSFNSSVNRRRHGMKKLRHRRMRWLMSVLLVDQMSLGEGARGGNLAFRLYDGSNFKLANPKCELTILYQLCAAGLMLSKTSFRKSDQFQSLTVFFSSKLTFVRTKRSYFL